MIRMGGGGLSPARRGTHPPLCLFGSGGTPYPLVRAEEGGLPPILCMHVGQVRVE